jgi:hypothetical protein
MIRHSQDIIAKYDNYFVNEKINEIFNRILRMIIDGYCVNDIARALMNERIPIPSEHFKRIGQPSRSNKYTDPYAWTATTIGYILSKEEYKGTIVLGKTHNSSYKGHKAVKTAENERYVFENALPAIVSTDDWENAQRLKKTVRRSPKSEAAPNPLTGLLFCADCGAKLTHRRSGYDNCYICSAYRKGIKVNCTTHYITVKSIEKILLSTIRRTVFYAKQNSEIFIEKIRETSLVKSENAIKESKKNLSKYKRRTEELNILIRKLYEDNATGKLPDKHFERIFAEYDLEQNELETKISALQDEVIRYDEDGQNAEKFLSLANKYTDFTELNPTLLNEFIERVDIHEKDKSGEKVRQDVVIHFNFIGTFELPEDFDVLTPEERAKVTAEEERLAKKNAYERERRRKKYQSDWHKQDWQKKKALKQELAVGA